MLRLVALVLAATLLVFTACADGETADQPPTHHLDFVPGPDDQRVVNPANPLVREYWLIHQQADGSHYLFPRPDGHPDLAAACDGDDAFGSIVRAARLCASGTNAADVARMNALSEDTALAVSTFLHERLEFRAVGNRVEPFALLSDRALICADLALPAADALGRVCDHALARADGTDQTDIGFSFTEAEARALADRLNELYSIPPPS